MNKKYYTIISSKKVTDELREKVANYYGEKEYADISDNPEFRKFMDSLRDNIVPGMCKAQLVNIGIASIMMSYADSAYFTSEWNDDDVCRLCHAMAFAYGLDVAYES